MPSNNSKKIFPFVLAFLLAGTACSQPATPPPATDLPLANTETVAQPTSMPEPTESAAAPAFQGIPVSFGSLSLVLPEGLASGASGMQVERVEPSDDMPPWGITPGNIQLDLSGYILQDKFHQPRIYVYPAPDYAAMYQPAADNITRLNNAMQGSTENLPTILFFNAGQVFASNLQTIDFQNGSGVRFVTEYAQFYAPVNNHDMFYNFQGLTSDGQYYIVAILPVTSPLVAEDSDPAAAVPTGGVALPDYNDANADWTGYYAAAMALLNGAAPDTFNPTLGQLDTLIASIQIAP